MPTTRYSNSLTASRERTARAYLREFRGSRKHALEICSLLRGMQVQRAKLLLLRVLDKKQAVPFHKYKRDVPHRGGEMHGCDAGRYPQKVSDAILGLIEEAEANASYKGLDVDRLVIRHINSYCGRHKRMHRASVVYGRRSLGRERAANVEVVLEER